MLSLDVLIQIAKLFHVSTDYLLGLETPAGLDLSGLTENLYQKSDTGYETQEINIRGHSAQCPQKQRFQSARSGVRTLDTLIKRHFIHYASPCPSSHTIQVFFPS